MAESVENALKPLRELCKKLDSKSSIDKIQQYIVKSKFYEYNVIQIITELLEKNEIHQNLVIVAAAFEILKFIILRKNFTDKILVNLYNMCLSQKKLSPTFIDELFNICKMEMILETKNVSICLYFNDQMCKINSIGSVKIKRDTIYRNMRGLIAKIENSDAKIQMDVFKIFKIRVEQYAVEDRNFTRIDEYIKEVIIGGLQNTKLKISCSEAFDIYLRLIEYIYKYKSVLSLGIENILNIGEMIKAVQKLLENEQQQRCNRIILSCNEMALNTPIQEKNVTEFYKQYYANISEAQEKSELELKTLDIATKMIFLNPENFSNTFECFNAYHQLVFSFFHILRNKTLDPNDIKNHCCSDIKRHEILKIVLACLTYLSQLVSSENASPKFKSSVEFYLKYGFELLNHLKCDSKNAESKKMFLQIFEFLCKFYEQESTIRQNLQTINVLYNYIVQMLRMNLNNINLEHYTHNITILGSKFFESMSEEKDKDLAILIAKGLLRVYELQNQLYKEATEEKKISHQKMILKTLFHMRKLAITLKFSCATKLIRWCLKSSQSKTKSFNEFSKEISLEEVLVREFISISRLDPKSVTERTSLFTMICNEVDDTLLFAEACSSIDEKVIKNCITEKFKELNERLEKEIMREDIDDATKLIASLFNNYYLFLINEKDLKNEINHQFEKEEIPKCYNLQTELSLINYLIKCLLVCNKLYACFEKNKTSMKKIISNKHFFSVIENISSQISLRGIEYKYIEAKSFLWKFLLLWDAQEREQQQKQEMILDAATFFLDNYNNLINNSGNYIRVNKSINPVQVEVVLKESNKMFECLAEQFNEVTPITQMRILNYLVSLWQFYFLNGKRDHGITIWNKFKTLEASSCIRENNNLHSILKAKVHFALAELSLKICQRNALDLINEAVNNIRDVSEISAEFSNNFYQISRNIQSKTLQFSANRLHDMDHFVVVLKHLKSWSIQKAYFLKTLEYVSLSVLWKLNMENVAEAKDELTVLTNLLGLKNEISIDVSLKEKQTYRIPNEIPILQGFRDSSINVPRKVEMLSNLNSLDDNDILERLLEFIHERSCKCNMCEHSLLRSIVFQVACHYSRLFWLLGKFNISKEFCENVLDGWRYFCSKVQRSNSKFDEVLSVSKMEFFNSSIRWLFQAADAFVRTGDFEEVEEIYAEIDLICTKNIFDYECIKQNLFSRNENLTLLKKHDKVKENEDKNHELVFLQFLKNKGINPKTLHELEKTETEKVKITKKLTLKTLTLPSTNRTPHSTAYSSTPILPSTSRTISASLSKSKTINDVIYIDSDESIIENELERFKEKEILKTPAINHKRITKKESGKSNKKNTEEKDSIKITPVARTRRRMI